MDVITFLVFVSFVTSLFDLVVMIFLAGLLVHTFRVERETKQAIAKGLSRCRELTEMIQKVYNSMF